MRRVWVWLLGVMAWFAALGVGWIGQAEASTTITASEVLANLAGGGGSNGTGGTFNDVSGMPQARTVSLPSTVGWGGAYFEWLFGSALSGAASFQVSVGLSTDYTGTWNAYVYAVGPDKSHYVLLGTVPVHGGGTLTYNAGSLSSVIGIEVDVVSQYYANNFTLSSLSATGIPMPPSVPSGVVVSNVSDKSALVSWSGDSTDQAFNVYLGGVKVVSGVTGTSYLLTGLSPNTSYSVTVTGVNSVGESAPSAAVNFTTFGPPGGAPTGVSVGQVTSSSAVVTWQAVQGATGYRVYLDGGSALSVAGTSCTLSGLRARSSHTVAVSAVNQYGEGPKSQAVSFTSGAVPKPIGLMASVGDETVTLSWQPVQGVVAFRVYQDGNLVQTLNTYSWTAKGLTNGQQYGFSVTAIDGAGNESDPATVSASPQPPPVPVNGLNAIGQGHRLTITWGGTMSPFQYLVKQKNTGKVVAQGTTSQTSVTVDNLLAQTDYEVTVTDKGNNTLDKVFNTGAPVGVLPPVMPDSKPTMQSMLDALGPAARYALAVIGGAVLLGVLVILAWWAWRLVKRWIRGADSGYINDVGWGRVWDPHDRVWITVEIDRWQGKYWYKDWDGTLREYHGKVRRREW